MIKQLHLNSFLGFELQAASATNHFPFVATVTFGGKPSDHLVGGTELIAGGPYRVNIPPRLLQAKIKELEGKAVFASDELNTHKDATRVGEFISAWTESVEDAQGHLVMVAKASGILYRDRDPELVDKILKEARAGRLGFSYDMKSVTFEDPPSDGASAQPVINLTGFQWRGATILYRDAAAYEETRLAASKNQIQSKGEIAMDKNELEQILQAALTPLSDGLAAISAKVNDIEGRQGTLEASLAAARDANNGKDQNSQKSHDSSAATSGQPQRVSLTDFATLVGTAVKDGNKDLTTAVAELKASLEKREGAGVRKTQSAAEIEAAAFVQKWAPDKKDEPISLELCDQAINAINADTTATKEHRMKALEFFGAAKSRIMRGIQLRGGVSN